RLRSLVRRLGVGAEVRVERRVHGGITGCGIVVAADETQPHRGMPEIEPLLSRAAFSTEVADRAIGVFRRIAEVEARVHGVPVEAIHFHEIGAVDSIVDILATVQALQDLAVGEITCSSIPLTSGRVRMAHGELPVPAPATSMLLTGWPVHRIDGEGEFLTPTAAGLLAALARPSAFPAMEIAAIGWGAGTRTHPSLPNVFRLWLGAPAPSARGERPFTPGFRVVSVLEAQIDDMDPRFLAAEIELLRAAGARDVFLSAIQMKKGRAGTLLTVVCDPGQVDELSTMVLRHTTTLGVRQRTEVRHEVDRQEGSVDTPWGPVRIKWSRKPDGWEAHPESDDLVERARRADLPIRILVERVAREIERLSAPRAD
ncbi:MAG: LarC family nickel insertion protein, partial [Candidatus Eisenbacteria bacterium]|nr:LarC family nickel insertion protein [Candidatus Eisenbacteria bacterium]